MGEDKPVYRTFPPKITNQRINFMQLKYIFAKTNEFESTNNWILKFCSEPITKLSYSSKRKILITNI